MIARLRQPSDEDALRLLLGENLGRLRKQDCVCVTGDVSGCLAFNPVALVHTMELRHAAMMRKSAETLVNYALGAARQMGYEDSLFIVKNDNHAMPRFLRALGAKDSYPAATILTLEVK